jgi:NAD-dependent DNA ligase
MSQVILENPNNKKRRACLVSHCDATRTNTHWPLVFSHPENLTNEQLMENKKAAVLERLEHVIEKLKGARKEILEAVLAALEMKEAGDDIADEMLVAMEAQDDIRNAEITMGQTQTKMIHDGLRKKDLIITQDFGIVKNNPLEEWCREAEKPLYLARYE